MRREVIMNRLVAEDPEIAPVLDELVARFATTDDRTSEAALLKVLKTAAGIPKENRALYLSQFTRIMYDSRRIDESVANLRKRYPNLSLFFGRYVRMYAVSQETARISAELERHHPRRYWTAIAILVAIVVIIYLALWWSPLESFRLRP